MIKKLSILTAFLILISNPAFSGSQVNPFSSFGEQQLCLDIQTEDGTIKTYCPGTLKVTNGSLTDNGDGTASLVISVDGLHVGTSGSAIPNLANANNYGKVQYYSVATLVNSSGLAWNWETQNLAQFTGSSTDDYALGFPSALHPGTAIIWIYQSSSGSNLLTFSDSRFIEGVSLADVVGNANEVVIYSFISNGTVIDVEAKDSEI